MAVIEDLFVYGSWCEGQENHKLLRPYITNQTQAYVVGQAYLSVVGYPVFVASGSDPVPGQLLSLEGPDFLTQLLDDLHGVNLLQPEKGLFQSVVKEVYPVGQSQSQLARVYALADRPEGVEFQLIPGGDWPSVLQKNPPLPARMTERQKNYIRRLSKSTGREIVPIDLDLYRELIKLELVVDKGRRLALTNLGREVLRHISG